MVVETFKEKTGYSPESNRRTHELFQKELQKYDTVDYQARAQVAAKAVQTVSPQLLHKTEEYTNTDSKDSADTYVLMNHGYRYMKYNKANEQLIQAYNPDVDISNPASVFATIVSRLKELGYTQKRDPDSQQLVSNDFTTDKNILEAIGIFQSSNKLQVDFVIGPRTLRTMFGNPEKIAIINDRLPQQLEKTRKELSKHKKLVVATLIPSPELTAPESLGTDDGTRELHSPSYVRDEIEYATSTIASPELTAPKSLATDDGIRELHSPSYMRDDIEYATSTIASPELTAPESLGADDGTRELDSPSYVRDEIEYATSTIASPELTAPESLATDDDIAKIADPESTPVEPITLSYDQDMIENTDLLQNPAPWIDNDANIVAYDIAKLNRDEVMYLIDFANKEQQPLKIMATELTPELLDGIGLCTGTNSVELYSVEECDADQAAVLMHGIKQNNISYLTVDVSKISADAFDIVMTHVDVETENYLTLSSYTFTVFDRIKSNLYYLNKSVTDEESQMNTRKILQKIEEDGDLALMCTLLQQMTKTIGIDAMINQDGSVDYEPFLKEDTDKLTNKIRLEHSGSQIDPMGARESVVSVHQRAEKNISTEPDIATSILTSTQPLIDQFKK